MWRCLRFLAPRRKKKKTSEERAFVCGVNEWRYEGLPTLVIWQMTNSLLIMLCIYEWCRVRLSSSLLCCLAAVISFEHRKMNLVHIFYNTTWSGSDFQYVEFSQVLLRLCQENSSFSCSQRAAAAVVFILSQNIAVSWTTQRPNLINALCETERRSVNSWGISVELSHCPYFVSRDPRRWQKWYRGAQQQAQKRLHKAKKKKWRDEGEKKRSRGEAELMWKMT